MTPPIAEADRSTLRAVRAGSIPLENVRQQLGAAAVRLRALTDASELPENGNRDEARPLPRPHLPALVERPRRRALSPLSVSCEVASAGLPLVVHCDSRRAARRRCTSASM
jgi:hypothetical protein